VFRFNHGIDMIYFLTKAIQGIFISMQYGLFHT